MNNPREKFIEVARRFVGIRETSKNRFLGDKKIWASTNYPNGWENREPYCAAFLCHILQISDMESMLLDFRSRPKMAATIDWIDWARNGNNGVMILKPGDLILPGDIVQFRPHFSHIGLVVSYNATKKIINTIEANTNDAGGNDGDGIYEKTRPLSICGEFYRLPVVPIID